MTPPAPTRMPIGWCGGLEHAARFAALGADFLEAGLAPLGLEDDARFARARALGDASPLPVPVFSQFLPRDFRIVGPDADHARVRRYLTRVAQVVAACHSDVVVFGSGWARNVPDGWSRITATQQFADVVRFAADALAPVGAIVALEAQNQTETNFLTTFPEARDFAVSMGVGLIADTYHLHMDDEPFETVWVTAPTLAHVHVSDSGRLSPGRGAFAFERFFRGLATGGFRGRLAIEMMSSVEDAEAVRILDFTRAAWAAAQATTS